MSFNHQKEILTAHSFKIFLFQLSEPEVLKYDKSMLVYNNPWGHPALRTAIAEFLTEKGNAPQPLDPNKVMFISTSLLGLFIGNLVYSNL